jgi:hypothetical protein
LIIVNIPSPGKKFMILVITLAIGAFTTYLAAIAALRRAGISDAYGCDVSRATSVSLVLSGVVFAIGAAWSVPADAISFSNGVVNFEVLHAWLALVGPVVSLVIVPTFYAAATVIDLQGRRPSDRWRTFGFPSLVAAVYAGLTIWSFATDPVGGWSRAPLWAYAPIPLHFIAVYASWIVYLRGMDRWAAKS